MRSFIDLIGCKPPPTLEPFTRVLSDLPESDHGCGLIVALESRHDVESLAAWLEQNGAIAPIAIGAVVPQDADILVKVARLQAHIDPIIGRYRLLPGRVLPDRAIEHLLERTAVHATLDAALQFFEIRALDQRDEELLRDAVLVACRGGQIGSWARRASVSRSSLHRWCIKRSLPPPGHLLRWLRVEFVDQLVDRGWTRSAAARLSGWMDPKKFYDVRSRVRRWEERHEMGGV